MIGKVKLKSNLASLLCTPSLTFGKFIYYQAVPVCTMFTVRGKVMSPCTCCSKMSSAVNLKILLIRHVSTCNILCFYKCDTARCINLNRVWSNVTIICSRALTWTVKASRASYYFLSPYLFWCRLRAILFTHKITKCKNTILK